MLPVRLWRHSRWLALLVAIFVCVIIATLLVSLSRPPGALVQTLGPLIIAWAFGAVSGILIAGDVLTRGRERIVPRAKE